MTLAFTDSVWHDFFALVGLIALAWMQFQTQKKLRKNTEVTEETHRMVNSAFLHQLRLHADTARMLADATGEEAHKQVAGEADRVLAEHLAAQRTRESKAG